VCTVVGTVAAGIEAVVCTAGGPVVYTATEAVLYTGAEAVARIEIAVFEAAVCTEGCAGLVAACTEADSVVCTGIEGVVRTAGGVVVYTAIGAVLYTGVEAVGCTGIGFAACTEAGTMAAVEVPEGRNGYWNPCTDKTWPHNGAAVGRRAW
jgi:hypothetical protein